MKDGDPYHYKSNILWEWALDSTVYLFMEEGSLVKETISRKKENNTYNFRSDGKILILYPAPGSTKTYSIKDKTITIDNHEYSILVMQDKLMWLENRVDGKKDGAYGQILTLLFFRR